MDRAPIASLASSRSENWLPVSAVEKWVAARVSQLAHEKRVQQIAQALFDLTRDLHNLDEQLTATLSAAALIHDVGREIDHKDHARQGANRILGDPNLRLSPISRRQVAYLTLYHRGPVPALGEDGVLGEGDDRPAMLKLLGLLRAADTLDSRSIEAPQLVLMRRGRRLQIWCLLRQPCERAVKAFCRPKKYRLLEETLACSVEVDVQQADARMLVGV